MRKIYLAQYDWHGNTIEIWAENDEQARDYIKQTNLPEVRFYNHGYNRPPSIIGMEYLVNAVKDAEPTSRDQHLCRMALMHEATFLLYSATKAGIVDPIEVISDTGIFHQMIHVFGWQDCHTVDPMCSGRYDFGSLLYVFKCVENKIPWWPKGEEQLGYHGIMWKTFKEIQDAFFNSTIADEIVAKFEYGSYESVTKT